MLLTFVGAAAGGVAALRSAAEQSSVPLTVVPVADLQIARLYERRLVLVRPDGHVAWRGDSVKAADLIIDTARGQHVHASAPRRELKSAG